MSITVGAIYENGVLKPERPLELQEKAKVRVTLEEAKPAAKDDDDPTGWKAIQSLMGIGKAVAPDVLREARRTPLRRPPRLTFIDTGFLREQAGLE